MPAEANATRRILYGPTLGSGGAFYSLPAHFGPNDFDVAVVSDPDGLSAVFPDFSGEIHTVTGHLNGFRKLCQLRRGSPASLIAVQNPCLWPRGFVFTETLLQNTKFIHPLTALGFEDSWAGRVRVVIASMLTELQVRRSRRVTVLSPDYPRRWRHHMSKVTVRPNTLPAMAAKRGRVRTRPRVTFVGTTERFRNASLAIKAFQLSGLGDHGWQLAVHATGSEGAREALKAIMRDNTTMHLLASGASPLETLSSTAIAVFPSALEGSSIAYLEALHLSRAIIAYDRPHFRVAHIDSRDAAEVVYIDNLHATAWADALRETARGFTFSTLG